MSGDEEEMEEGELIERMRARIGGNLMEEMDAAATNMDSPARREKVRGRPFHIHDLHDLDRPLTLTLTHWRLLRLTCAAP